MYIVIELQTNDENKTATLVTTYEDKNKAESKFHTILAAASESNVPIHAATILNERGDIERSEFYRHETVEKRGTPIKDPVEEPTEEPVEEEPTEEK